MAVVSSNGLNVEMAVGRNTNVHNLAVSIQKYVQEGKKVMLVAIGANAVNQMIKGAAKSRAFLAPVGKDVAWKTYFTDRQLTEEEIRDVVDGGERKDKLSAVVMESVLI